MAASILVSPYGLSVDSLPGGLHYLDKVSFGPLTPEQKVLISDYLDKIAADPLSRFVRQRPIFCIPCNDISVLRSVESVSEKLDYAIQIHRYSLQSFSRRLMPMAAFYSDGSQVVEHSYNQHEVAEESLQNRLVEVGVWESHLTYLRFLYEHLHKAPLARLAISRLCRAIQQGPNSDGLVDLAIGLECVSAATTEIKFQFSLFHSLLSSSRLDTRTETYKLLRSFYDVRSLLIHGGSQGKSYKAKIKEVQDNWEKLLSVAQASLTYYILFCHANDPKNWADHLRDLALGHARLQAEL